MSQMKILTDGQLLTMPQYKALAEFYFYLLKSTVKAVPVYRGESLEVIYKKLGLDIKYNDLSQLSERLFMYGDKSKYLFSEVFFGKKTGRVFRVNEVNKDVIKYIFEKLASTIKNPNPYNQLFFKKNRTFAGYFSDKTLLEDFIQKISILPEKRQLLIRNYYLRLLHQLAEASYKHKTHLVSTTTSYKVANKFSKGRNKQPNIIIHAWLPSLMSEHNLFVRTDLPRYKGVPYAQSEVSVLGGILPHYILGAEIPGEKVFLINPWLFRKPVTNQTISQGFDIDQTNFVRDLANTRYGGYYEQIDGNIYDHI